MTEVSLLNHQAEFIFSDSKKCLALGGIGSGKSVAGSHFAIRMLSEYPTAKGIITANTYTQLMNATVEAFIAELENCAIPYKAILSGARKRIEVGPTKIYLYSLEKYDAIRGVEAGWWWSDESLFAKPEAIQVVRGRLRDKKGPLYERHTSSPNGYNWGYDEFENFDDKNKTAKTHLVRAKTKENIFLPQDYYSDLLEEYGGEENPLAQQELMGQFVNMQAGAVYWAYDEGKHVVPVKPDPRYPVYVGQDFNIDNMSAPFVQRIDGEYRVFDENVLQHYGANTDNAAVTMKEKLKEYNIVVVPDSTANARKTSSIMGMTDIEILKSHDLKVLPTHNPLIRDRQNTLNVLFKKNRIKIDPKCKHLRRELASLSARDKEGDEAHVSVGLGYITWKFDPLLRRVNSQNIQL